MKSVPAALAAALVMGCAHAAPSAKPAATPAGFGWFGELVGSCWKGAHPTGAASDTQCYTLQYDRVIRGTIKANNRMGNVEEAFEGEAAFAADPERKRVQYAQWASNGTFGTGDFTFEGDSLVFVNRLADGTAATVRAVWRRTGPDGFRVVRERSSDKGWVPILEVEYRRVP